MADTTHRKRIWGWFFFDWASQPYNTLLLTFIFGPYVKDVLGDGTAAQSAWGFGIGAAGIAIALLAPVLGALADTSGRRVRWIWGFSVLYVVGASGLWFAAPDDFNLLSTMTFFALGLIGMEFATIFTNSMLPELGTREEIGRLSGNGWAFGYLGGLLALVIMLAVFEADPLTGTTMAGITPPFGLDVAAREGTRFVGPLTALWYVVFMVPFFLWVRDPRTARPAPGTFATAIAGLGRTLRRLPQTRSLFAYLLSSMVYRDALNGMYVFGGIYAAGVLGWSVTQTGIFGIVAIVAGAVFAWLGGRADAAFGPRPVIAACILVLTCIAVGVVFISRTSVFGIGVAPESSLPDIAFMVLGAGIGAAGGALQSASRTMLVRQANPARMTEAFGLYALAGKATSFLAPLLIGIATWASASQQIGVTPLIGLFVLGLFLLRWVKPDGDRAV
ncbi:MFS transporter [Oceaniglobus indicus]|uniref:MFS transporter n=1 Tax=Oceaniglobus indicus TaxID=2047749 RepID=UPI000C19E54E|nr:MFS transporter [Oceaniglobus indicus]